MGFSFSAIAVKGGSREAVLATLGLRGTGKFQEIPDSEIDGAMLPAGWYLVISSKGDGAIMEEAMLTRLSASAEVANCFVEEHVMCSSAAFWKNGRKVWSVMHAADEGIEHLDTQGELPPFFAGINEELRAKQQAETQRKKEMREKHGADYFFTIPVELFVKLTGYRYDEVQPELGENPFEVLEETERAKPKRSFVKRLFGL